jgi:hypothetical protein
MFSRSRMLLAVAAGIAFMGNIGFTHSAPVPQAVTPKKARRGLLNGRAHLSSSVLFGRKGASISAAQQKRNATKRSNQRRHKQLATRG